MNRIVVISVLLPCKEYIKTYTYFSLLTPWWVGWGESFEFRIDKKMSSPNLKIKKQHFKSNSTFILVHVLVLMIFGACLWAYSKVYNRKVYFLS